MVTGKDFYLWCNLRLKFVKSLSDSPWSSDGRLVTTILFFGPWCQKQNIHIYICTILRNYNTSRYHILQENETDIKKQDRSFITKFCFWRHEPENNITVTSLLSLGLGVKGSDLLKLYTQITPWKKSLSNWYFCHYH